MPFTGWRAEHTLRTNRELVLPEFADEFERWGGTEAVTLLDERVHPDVILAAVLRPGLEMPYYGMPLYLITRLLRPKVAMESGVCSGCSTRCILAAMERNDHGHLYSIDMEQPEPYYYTSRVEVESTLGVTLASGARLRSPRWTFVLGDIETYLPKMLDTYGPVNLYWQDTGAEPERIEYELRTVMAHLDAHALVAHHNDFGHWDRSVLGDDMHQVFGGARPRLHIDENGTAHNILRGWVRI